MLVALICARSLADITLARDVLSQKRAWKRLKKLALAVPLYVWLDNLPA
jgi:hypothetical protein